MINCNAYESPDHQITKSPFSPDSQLVQHARVVAPMFPGFDVKAQEYVAVEHSLDFHPRCCSDLFQTSPSAADYYRALGRLLHINYAMYLCRGVGVLPTLGDHSSDVRQF